MTVAGNEEKMMTISSLLEGDGSTKAMDFLKRKGHTLEDVVGQGGWMAVLAKMVPDEYGTAEELVKTIKSI